MGTVEKDGCGTEEGDMGKGQIQMASWEVWASAFPAPKD